MNQPILHLLNREPRDPARRAILLEALLPLAGTSPCPHKPRLVTFACDKPDGRLPTLLGSALQRHPNLASIQITTLPAISCRSQDIGDLLVYTQASPVRGDLLFEAMHRRVPLLVPDNWCDTCVRDGVNGFFYRAGNPDSLALSLLAFVALPAAVLAEIARRAHLHAIGLTPSRRFTPPEQPTGDVS